MFQHTIQYYETDMMGITHHSNYIRFMEEARIAYLKKIGLDYALLEQSGIISPILHVECNYMRSTTFGDCIETMVIPEEFTGVKIILRYEMKNQKNEVVAIGKSVNAFVDKQMKPLRLKRDYPKIYEILSEAYMQKSK